MNFPVTLFVIPFLCVQVLSATIPVNVGQNEGEGLQDLSARLYLADPNFENSIVGATMKKNMKKLCEQCKNSPLCRGKANCQHCAKYCEAYGAETKENTMMASSMEEVGIAREPENDFMRNEDEKDTTLVSRFADEGMNSNGMAGGMEQEERVQMVHQPMAGGMMGEEMVMEKQLEHEGHKGQILHENRESRYYTAGVIRPGLLMNIMLKLINIKETNDIEKVVVLVKSKKSVAVATGMVEENETELLKMLRDELETTEKIHGKSPLDSKDINKILETAYEKGGFKSKTATKIVSEADTLPIIQNEKITRSDFKRVPTPIEMERNPEKFESPLEILEESMAQDKLEREMESSKMQAETNMKFRNKEENNMRMMSSHSFPEGSSLVGSANVEGSENNEMVRQNVMMGAGTMKNLGTKQEIALGNTMEMDSEIGDFSGENEKERTFHKKKYKKKKKGHMHGHSYGGYNEPYGYYRSNDDPEQQADFQENQENLDAITGAQEEGLRPLNEDRIGAKDDWQRDQKGFQFKGEGGLLQDQEKPQKMRNTENLVGMQQEGLKPLNEDRIGAKEGWQQDQKGYIFKGEGGLLRDLENTPKTRNNAMIDTQQSMSMPLSDHLEDKKTNWQRNQQELISERQEGQLEELTRSHNTRNQQQSQQLLEDPMNLEDGSFSHSERKAEDSIAKITVSEKNKMLDPKKVLVAQPSEDNHDGMPDPFHTRIHAHFNKVQEYFNNQSAKSTRKSDSVLGMAESTIMQNNEDADEPDIMMQTRNNEENSDSMNGNPMNMEPDNPRLANSLGMREETLSNQETSDMRAESKDDTPKVGINFQPEDLINLQMANEHSIPEERMDETPKVGINIQPEDMIILQNKQEKEKLNQFNRQAMNFEGSMNSGQSNVEKPGAKASAPPTNIIVTDDIDDFQNPINGPQFAGDENLPGQTVIQVDDQLIDVPDEGASIFQVNSQPVVAVSNKDDQESEKMFMNQPMPGDIEPAENVGAKQMLSSENQRVNPQVMKDQSGQNLGLLSDMSVLKSESPHPNQPSSAQTQFAPSYSFREKQQFRAPKIIKTGNEGMQRSSVTENSETANVEAEFPTSDISPMKTHPFAPAFEGFRSAKTIHTAEDAERSSATEKLEGKAKMTATEKVMKVNSDDGTEIVGNKRMEDETAIEKKIERLITPREQEFLHNFGKIVPSIEKMHLNSKSDIYFMGNGIKLPLKMSPNNDGSISLSVDLEKLCKCRNSTCAHKLDMINKLDENMMGLSDEDSAKEKHDNDIPHIVENPTEKKIRKPRNHVDLSKLYRTYRKKYHKLNKRSVSEEYFRRFKDIEQGLEKKLDELNENVKKSNREYDNMLRKGTKDLLQIKEEDQIVKQRIELVNDLLKWMKEMASEGSIVESVNKNNVQFR